MLDAVAELAQHIVGNVGMTTGRTDPIPHAADGLAIERFCRSTAFLGAIAACGALAAEGVILCGDEAALDYQLSLIKEDRP